MKLLYCPKCHDLFNLRLGNTKSCACGMASGRYLDDGLNAEYSGGIPVGFDNFSFVEAIRAQPEQAKYGPRFTAFIIPKICDTMKKI
jgi:hypothetical protein